MTRIAIAVAVVLALPWIPGLPPFWITLGNMIGISAIVALGLVVLTGFGAMTSFGQASFVGFGAYATAILTVQHGVSPWLALPVSLAAAGLAALAIASVTLRLSGHYLALGTIAWSVALYYAATNLDAVGRNDGISAIPPLELFGVRLIDPRRYFAVVWLGVLGALLATARLLDSRAGRAIRALRGGAVAAASCGVDIPRTRTLAFVYAAMLAGFAGWLYAHMQRSVNPTPFGLNASIEYLLMAVVGGAGHLGGAVLGAGLVVVARDLLQDWLPRLGLQGNYETVAFGIVLVAVLQRAPDGLWPHLAAVARRVRGPMRTVGAWRPQVPLADKAARPPRALPAPGTVVLEVAGLGKRFGGLVAVRDLDFVVRAGEITGLIGPNGAGKSTTFALLSGVAATGSGRVAFLGRPVLGMAPARIAALGMARSFQHVKLVSGMSVLENVAIGGHLHGAAGALSALLRLDRREEAALFAEAGRALHRTGLAELADRPATSLALGLQRIVEIARCLCLDPVLLLLDEPAAGLRHSEKRQLAGLLRQLRAEGVAILLVEHDMEFVMELADRLVVMDFGSKLAEGPPGAVRDDPAVIDAYLGVAA